MPDTIGVRQSQGFDYEEHFRPIIEIKIITKFPPKNVTILIICTSVTRIMKNKSISMEEYHKIKNLSCNMFEKHKPRASST